MRTTIDINDAILAELREQSAREGRPFREILNRILKLGLAVDAKVSSGSKRVKISPKAVNVKPGLRGQSMNQLYDQLEAEDQAPVARVAEGQ